MAEKNIQGQCSGNCMSCNIYQRQYCASQISYSNMKMLEQMTELLNSLDDKVKGMEMKIDAIQNSEAVLINPMEE